MLPAAVPLQFRIALSHVDRGIDRVQNVIVERHRLETREHLILRVLAWCLFYDDELRFGPGLSARNAADLWARDSTGRTTVWVECGAADADALRKVVLHNRGVAIHVLFGDPEGSAELLRQIGDLKRRPPELDSIGIWGVDPELVARLATSDHQRQRWSVTVVGDHLYVESDGVTFDSELQHSTLPPRRG
jgi:uncharacterized protein YaeQ